MMTLQQEIAAFKAAKKADLATVSQTAALQIACHADLRELLLADAGDRVGTIAKLRRLIERERLKGLRRHWSYDLNRHIALKQALDRLLDEPEGSRTRVPARPPRASRHVDRRRRLEGRRS